MSSNPPEPTRYRASNKEGWTPALWVSHEVQCQGRETFPLFLILILQLKGEALSDSKFKIDSSLVSTFVDSCEEISASAGPLTPAGQATPVEISFPT